VRNWVCVSRRSGAPGATRRRRLHPPYDGPSRRRGGPPWPPSAGPARLRRVAANAPTSQGRTPVICAHSGTYLRTLGTYLDVRILTFGRPCDSRLHAHWGRSYARWGRTSTCVLQCAFPFGRARSTPPPGCTPVCPTTPGRYASVPIVRLCLPAPPPLPTVCLWYPSNLVTLLRTESPLRRTPRRAKACLARCGRGQ